MRAILQKRTDKPLIDWLGQTEMQAILDAPDVRTIPGLRDRSMLHLCYAAGLRVSELTTLTLDSLSNPQLESIRIMGKGRRERELPLWKETKTVLGEWLDIRPPVNNRYLFLNARGRGTLLPAAATHSACGVLLLRVSIRHEAILPIGVGERCRRHPAERDSPTLAVDKKMRCLNLKD